MNNDIDILNEEQHIPDKDNITKLVDALIDEIYKSTASVLYMHMPFTGNTDPDKVSVDIELKNINKFCSWIGDHNRVVCDIWFNQDESGVVSNFDEQVKDLGIIIQGDKNFDIPNKIDFCQIKIEVSVKKGTYNYNDLYLKIKYYLRHELGHMYGESQHPTICDVSETTDNSKRFMDGYDKLMTYIKDRDLNKYEKTFLDILYRCCYIERTAHICGFYQLLINDVCSGKGLGDFKSYNEYLMYYRYKEFIHTNDISSLFEKYKEIIHDMYGININTLERFINILDKHIDKIIKNLMNVYYSVYEISRDSVITESLNHDKIKNDYYERYRKSLFSDKVFEDTVDQLIAESILKDHMNSTYQGYLRILDFIFNNDGK